MNRLYVRRMKLLPRAATAAPQVDTLVSDKLDKDSECETVRAPFVLATKVKLRGTGVSIPVRCFAIPPATCLGTMAFYVTPRAVSASRRVRIARKRFKVKAGRRRAIRLRLSPGAATPGATARHRSRN